MIASNALTQLLFQFQTTARTAPSPAAKKLQAHSYGVGRAPNRQQNDSINNSPLRNKSDPGNPLVKGAIQAPLDLREIGYWLKLLLGAPNTTGTGPYTHSFPVNLSDRPFALLEYGHTDISRFFRTLDAHLDKMAWDIMNKDQNVTLDILAGEETDPVPTAVFDASPTSLTVFRANSGSGAISDGTGATLGQVVGGSIEIANNMKPEELADGYPGYGAFPVGELVFKGKLKAFFDTANAWTLARAGTSTRLKMVSAATIGGSTFTLTVDMPYVELMENPITKVGRSGILVDVDWQAVTGATLPTVVLVNDVASY